jgi:hypothetical protein
MQNILAGGNCGSMETKIYCSNSSWRNLRSGYYDWLGIYAAVEAEAKRSKDSDGIAMGG